MSKSKEQVILSVLKKVAPGTALRQGLDHILAARTGALIVIGDIDKVMSIVNGGFRLECPFTPQKLYELAKMDGAIIVDGDISRILLANVHLVPDSSLPTSETGMRHRTAERVSKHTKALVISISQKREVVTLYINDYKYALEDIRVVLAKANQALQTLEKYKFRLDQVSSNLTALEFQNLVVPLDVVAVLQRAEMVSRITHEIEHYIGELGVEGRLLRMQLDELVGGVEEETLMVIKDYCEDSAQSPTMRRKLGLMDAEEILDAAKVAAILGFEPGASLTDEAVGPRGYRLLNRIPRLPAKVEEAIIEEFKELQALLSASVEELDRVEGVGEVRARAIADGLRRLKEYSLLEKFA